MQLGTWQRIGVGLIASVGVLAGSGADAKAAKQGAGTYSLEFRSRATEIAGHSYVVARKTAANGRVVAERVSGFRPSNINASTWSTVRGVAGTVGTYREDFKTKPSLTYRVNVSQGAYRRAMAKIDEVSRKPPKYRALSQNCNTFLGDVARAARLDAPSGGTADRAESYVSNLRELNNGDRTSGHKSAPLRR